MTRPSQAGFEPGIFRSRGGRLNYWPTRRSLEEEEEEEEKEEEDEEEEEEGEGDKEEK